jgi:hypothetical protein
MVLAIVSNIEPATVMKWVKKRFGKIPPYPAKSPVIAIPPKVSGVVEVNKPMEKEQIYIYLGNISFAAVTNAPMRPPDPGRRIYVFEVAIEPARNTGTGLFGRRRCRLSR